MEEITKVCPPPARDSNEIEECKSLVINIPSDLPPEEWSECCIYRIPKHLRKVNEEAYTPKLVSIGPFHHGKDGLKDMEQHKLKYLDNFLKRTMKSQKDLLKFIKVDEVKIRHCYSEDCEPNSDNFVKMILLDAVFIIELFDKKSRYILSKSWLAQGILHDLILLENQLPFFVLEKLYRFAFGDSSSRDEEGQQIKEHKDKDDQKKEDTQFVKKARNYFRCYDRQDEERKSIIDENVKHFTDLLRYLFCPPKMEQHWKSIMDQEKESSGIRFWQFCPPKMEQHRSDLKEKQRNKEKSSDSNKKQEEESSGTPFWQFCPPKKEQHWNDMKEKRRNKETSSGIRYCATKIHNAGLNFKQVKGDRRLLDIQPPGVMRCFPCFGRPMEVPQLVIDDYTESVLRNLMALEQCHYPHKTYICNYVVLLDCLIDTQEDVDLLVHKKIIDNLLGSNAIVADLTNKLCDHIVENQHSYFEYIARKLNQHYEYPLNRTMATLKREYFPNVFRGTATVVGLIVLLFTLWSFVKPFVV